MDEPAPTQFLDREIVVSFDDIGTPEITSAEEGATQRNGATDLVQTAAFMQWYRCQLNIAGVALGRVQPVAACLEVIERGPPQVLQPAPVDATHE